MEQIVYPTISIVTPTYNRGKLLQRCYQSLQKQTCFDFEWIVIDDGSTDDTESLMKNIKQSESNFPIVYIWKENNGKHTALNASHELIHGKYVLILDSDDQLTEDAIDVVIKEWDVYKDNLEIGLLTFYRKHIDGRICAYAKEEGIPVDVIRYKRINVCSSDCCEVIRTNLFTQYAFPIFPNERFLAETALWYRVGLDYKTIYPGKTVYITEYQEGGLTKSGRRMRIKNPLGGMYTSYLRMHRKCFLSERIRATLLYICYGSFAKKTFCQMYAQAKPYAILFLLGWLPGKLMYFDWRKKYGNH